MYFLLHRRQHESEAIVVSCDNGPKSTREMAVNEQPLIRAEQKLQVKAGQSDAAATFIIGDEDHTLGNVLRHVLMQT